MKILEKRIKGGIKEKAMGDREAEGAGASPNRELHSLDGKSKASRKSRGGQAGESRGGQRERQTGRETLIQSKKIPSQQDKMASQVVGEPGGPSRKRS